MSLLEPGGYLHWEEGDVASLHSKSPGNKSIIAKHHDHQACDRFHEHWVEWCGKVGLEFE